MRLCGGYHWECDPMEFVYERKIQRSIEHHSDLHRCTIPKTSVILCTTVPEFIIRSELYA